MRVIKRVLAYWTGFKRRISRYNGLIKRNNQFITGWAYHISKKKTAYVTLYLNNHKLESQYATVLNKHLREKKVHPTGECGFRFRINEPLKPGDEIAIKTGKLLKTHLRNSPILIPQFNSNDKMLDYFSTKTYTEPKVFFMHIPKTAGTAFKHILNDRFKRDQQIPDKNTFINNLGYPPFHYPLELSEKQILNCNLLFGHHPYMFRKLLGSNTQVILFLRDPDKRSLSGLYQLRNHDKGFLNKSMDRIYRMSLPVYSNMYVRYLWNDDTTSNLQFHHPPLITASHYEQAITHLEQCFFVGITEYFNASITLLERKWDTSLGRIRRKNVTRKKAPVDTDLLQLINKNNEFDHQLYKHALGIFKRECVQYGIELKE